MPDAFCPFFCCQIFARSLPDQGDPRARFFLDFQKYLARDTGPVPRARFWQRFSDCQIVPDFGVKFLCGFDNGLRADYSSSLSSSLAAVAARSSCRPRHHCHRRCCWSLSRRHRCHRRSCRHCRRRFRYTVSVAVAVAAVVVSPPPPPPLPLPPPLAVTVSVTVAFAVAVTFLVDCCLCLSAAAL